MVPGPHQHDFHNTLIKLNIPTTYMQTTPIYTPK
ncbi:hypothetical protein DFR28_102171 [Arenicella xantha]|uniref:Uncharacterized protein n=1 Tax=Arenicella xantha TaxID=644221 RepID=A0A395JJR5_9GAMM|nr:hypothetical protein DFR28_102171 [Arenicella xantha]